MTDITFSQVQKSFHKKVVLDIPDFQAKSGEICSIVGGNGAGKSTFIKLLAGIFLQDKGEVRVHGVSNRSKKIHSLVKFVLESGQGSWRSCLTAMENLQYFLGLNGIALSHIKSRSGCLVRPAGSLPL
ncbi:MAG: ATP-binding cassette domain-containing protein [Streptococcus sp.]|uniref:ATP-binding cassette domain-containing protein n=1 Tax=Streptococcus sp. TaxID=1306 RepID=UPI0039957284